MRIQLLILLLITCNYISFGQVVVNANVIRGEQFVTTEISELKINKIVESALLKKGYNLVDKLASASNPLIIETFLYQKPYQYPTIILVARSNQGVHFIAGDYIKLYLTTKIGFVTLIEDMMRYFPSSIDSHNIIDVDIKSLFTTTRKSLQSITTESLSELTTIDKNFKVEASRELQEEFFLDDLYQYIYLSLNLNSMKIYLKGKSLTLHLSLDSKGKMQIESIESPFTLNDNQKAKLRNSIRGIPTWLNQQDTGLTVLVTSLHQN